MLCAVPGMQLGVLGTPRVAPARMGHVFPLHMTVSKNTASNVPHTSRASKACFVDCAPTAWQEEHPLHGVQGVS